MRAISLIALSGVLSAQSSVDDGIRQFHRGAYSEAERILAAHPNDSTSRAFLAMSQAARGDCAKAEPELSNQVSTESNAEVQRLVGLALTQCLLSRKDFRSATQVVGRLQEMFPKDGDVLYEAARVHMRAWNDAVFLMYQNSPASFRVNQLSAEVFEAQGRFPEAIAEYRKAIQKNPKAINLHFRLGRALLMSSSGPETLKQAQAEFENELAINPFDSAAEYEIGQILVTKQDSPGAAVHFAKAVSLSPEFPEAFVALARTHLDAKRTAEAIALLQRAVQLRPKMESAHYSLMMAYRNAGRTEDAFREKAELEKLQKPPEGEFTEFLKKLGEPSKP